MTPTEQFVNFLIKNKPVVDAADNVIADSVGMLESALEQCRALNPEVTTEEVVTRIKRVDFNTAIAMVVATHSVDLLKDVVKEYVTLKTKATRKPWFYQRWWWTALRKLR